MTKRPSEAVWIGLGRPWGAGGGLGAKELCEEVGFRPAVGNGEEDELEDGEKRYGAREGESQPSHCRGHTASWQNHLRGRILSLVTGGLWGQMRRILE